MIHLQVQLQQLKPHQLHLAATDGALVVAISPNSPSTPVSAQGLVSDA
jgi:hypothetical protein